MNLLNEYNSIYEASTKLLINYSCIRDTCIGKQKTSGGFIFRYK